MKINKIVGLSLITIRDPVYEKTSVNQITGRSSYREPEYLIVCEYHRPVKALVSILG